MTKNGWLWVAILGGLALATGTGVVMSGFSDQVQRIAKAIADAEGFGPVGNRATRNNNPGDLTYSFGFATIGQDGPFPIFASVTDGWNALYTQIEDIFSGSSHWSPDMSIAQIGQTYANGDPNWSINVANALGVDVNTPLSEV